MRHRPGPSTRFIASAVALVALSALSAGCEIIVDFNRALIEGGVDGSFSVEDAGDAGFAPVDSGADGGLGVPDAVSDVVFSDVSCDTCTPDAKAGDASLDAKAGDAKAGDASLDAKAGDATTVTDGATKG